MTNHPTPATAEARATKAIGSATDRILSWANALRAHAGHHIAAADLEEAVADIKSALSLPPPEAKEGAAPSPETGTHYAWLIEWPPQYTSEYLQYWSGVKGWTRAHTQAVRFARKDDAERAAEYICYTIDRVHWETFHPNGWSYKYRVAEHGWDGEAPRVSLPPPEAKHGAAPTTNAELRVPFDASRDGAAPSHPETPERDGFQPRSEPALEDGGQPPLASRSGTTAPSPETGERELLEALNEWFGQREQGVPTTNSEATLFQRVHMRLAAIEPAPAAPSPDIVSLGRTALHRTAEGAERELREIVAAGRPAAPSPDLAVLEELNARLVKSGEGGAVVFQYADRERFVRVLHDAILHLKAQQVTDQ